MFRFLHLVELGQNQAALKFATLFASAAAVEADQGAKQLMELLEMAAAEAQVEDLVNDSWMQHCWAQLKPQQLALAELEAVQFQQILQMGQMEFREELHRLGLMFFLVVAVVAVAEPHLLGLLGALQTSELFFLEAQVAQAAKGQVPPLPIVRLEQVEEAEELVLQPLQPVMLEETVAPRWLRLLPAAAEMAEQLGRQMASSVELFLQISHFLAAEEVEERH
jgi:hypothetical protein